MSKYDGNCNATGQEESHVVQGKINKITVCPQASLQKCTTYNINVTTNITANTKTNQ